jgi:hypothetical protein
MPISLSTRPAATVGTSTHAVPRSQAERLWLIAGGLTAMLLILIGYFVAISPQRSETSKVDAKVSAAKVQNGILQQRIDALRLQNKNLARYRADLATAKLALPSESGVSDFLRSLQSLGARTGTHVTTLTVGDPTDVTSALTVAPAGKAGAAAPAPAPAAATATSAAGRIFALAISANVSGPPVALNKFLEQLQAVQPRAVLITEITETDGTAAKTAGTANGSTLQISMQAFVAPTA